MRVAHPHAASSDRLRPRSGAYDYLRVAGVTCYTLSPGYIVGPGMTARLVIDNLAGRGLRFNAVAAGGTRPYFSGLLGRTVRVGIAAPLIAGGSAAVRDRLDDPVMGSHLAPPRHPFRLTDS